MSRTVWIPAVPDTCSAWDRGPDDPDPGIPGRRLVMTTAVDSITLQGMVQLEAPEVTGYRSDGAGAAVALVNAITTRDGDSSDGALRAILTEFRFLVEELTPGQAVQL